MQIACFPNTYGRFGVNAAIDLLPETGVRWLELPIKNAGQPSFFKEQPVATDASTPQLVSALKERIREAGLRVSSCNITSGNPLDPAVFDRTLNKLSVASQFGVSLVVAGGGEVATDDEWSVLVSHMRQIGDRCADLGITYCCETHPGTCQNSDRMLEFLKRVDHPHIQINFDTGNIFYYNQSPDLFAQMQAVASHIKHVHLKDTTGKFEDWHFPALGAAGQVDFTALREFLESINYDGPCSLELEGIQGEPELTLDQTHQRVVDSVAHLKKCGWQIE